MDDESGLSADEYDEVVSIVKNTMMPYDKIDHIHGKISNIMSASVVKSVIEQYNSHRVVVIDRFHGIIFSIICKTSCIALRNQYYKNEEMTGLFSNSNAVFFIDNNISKLKNIIDKALSVTQPIYPIMEEKPFEIMANIIKQKVSEMRKQ